MTPTGLILAGVALSSFSAISQVLSLQFDLNQDLAFWFIGGAANVTWTQLQVITYLSGGALHHPRTREIFEFAGYGR